MDNYNRICGINENLLYDENENQYSKMKKKFKIRKQNRNSDFKMILEKEIKRNERRIY